MNIFENYLLKIEKIIKSAQKDNLLELPDNLSGINVDIPPAKFSGDISTNVAMVLSKINKKPPLELAKQIADLIKNSDNNIDEISIEKPGFINLKFKTNFWNVFILERLYLETQRGILLRNFIFDTGSKDIRFTFLTGCCCPAYGISERH